MKKFLAVELMKHHQPVWYRSSEDYNRFAREQFEWERKVLARLGLARKP